MSFPIKVCAICSEEFELKPGKPGFANHCQDCSTPEENNPVAERRMKGEEREVNEARRRAIRDLLYRKDS
jgi:hypothetical protein